MAQNALNPDECRLTAMGQEQLPLASPIYASRGSAIEEKSRR